MKYRNHNHIQIQEVANALWEPHQHTYLGKDNDGNNLHAGLMVSFDVDMAYYGFEEDGNTESKYDEKIIRRDIQFLYYGSTIVFMRAVRLNEPDLSAGWVMVSNHDSCWRDFDANVRDVFEEMYEHVISHIPEEDRFPNIISTHIWPSNIGKSFVTDMLIAETHENDPDAIGEYNSCGYIRKIVSAAPWGRKVL